MSRELLLLRHAKSRRDDPTAEDHDRDLAPRGRAAAVGMAKVLHRTGLIPDLVLCSTARRASLTWSIMAAELPSSVPVRHLRSLYLAPPSRLLDIVRRQGAAPHRLLLVGHNPGMETFARALAGEGGAKARRALDEKFPTGALAQIRFDLAEWTEITHGSGHLEAFYRPRDLD